GSALPPTPLLRNGGPFPLRCAQGDKALELEAVREQLVEGVLPDLRTGPGAHVDGVDVELGHDLATPSARIGGVDVIGIDAGDGHDVDLADALGGGGVDRRRLGARRHRIGSILDVGAHEGLAVRTDHHGADPEVGVRGVCVPGRAAGDVDQLFGSHAVKSATNPAGSNTSKSSGRSPVPTNLIGTPNSFSTATTIPPRAVPSSFDRITPLRGTALANSLTWASPFCPAVASSTRSTSVTRLA